MLLLLDSFILLFLFVLLFPVFSSPVNDPVFPDWSILAPFLQVFEPLLALLPEAVAQKVALPPFAVVALVALLEFHGTLPLTIVEGTAELWPAVLVGLPPFAALSSECLLRGAQALPQFFSSRTGIAAGVEQGSGCPFLAGLLSRFFDSFPVSERSTSPEIVPSVWTAEVPLEVASLHVRVPLLLEAKFAAHEEYFSVVLGLRLPVIEELLVSLSSGQPVCLHETFLEGFLVQFAIRIVC